MSKFVYRTAWKISHWKKGWQSFYLNHLVYVSCGRYDDDQSASNYVENYLLGWIIGLERHMPLPYNCCSFLFSMSFATCSFWNLFTSLSLTAQNKSLKSWKQRRKMNQPRNTSTYRHPPYIKWNVLAVEDLNLRENFSFRCKENRNWQPRRITDPFDIISAFLNRYT